MLIAMDPPVHDDQRKTVQGSVAPANLKHMENHPRTYAESAHGLPVGEQFDWVDREAIELTTQTLATLFDFPFEDRRKLTRWSDVATGDEESGIVESEEARQAELYECSEYFMACGKNGLTKTRAPIWCRCLRMAKPRKTCRHKNFSAI